MTKKYRQYNQEQLKQVISLKIKGESIKKISEIMGFSHGQVRRIWRNYNDPDYDGVLKLQERFDDQVPEEPKEPEVESWYWSESYVYNADNDTYVTFLPGAHRPLAIPGDVHRAMLQSYSDWDGAPATINEICRTFHISRPDFEKYKRIHGWTHDREPFSKEELETRPVDDMVEEAIQARRQNLWQKYERRKWRDIKENADKWLKFEYSVMEPLKVHISQYAPTYIPHSVVLSDDRKQCVAILSLLADLHYGKYSWDREVSETYSRKVAKERVYKALDVIINSIAGRVEKIILPVGSDDTHIDNYIGTTTASTPQDLDGTPAQIIQEYAQILIDIIDRLRQIANITVVNVPGNHNRYTATMHALYVDAWFKDADDVEVIINAKTRKYIEYGKVLIGLTHGDSEKLGNLPSLMANEAVELWGGARMRVWITNHLHKDEMKNTSGVRVYVTPSLSGEDRWHYRKGYTDGKPAVCVYVIDKEGTFIDVLTIPVK